jgi:hypothetical protein
MMRRHDQMAPRDRDCNDTALLERSSAARTVVRTGQRPVKIALRGRSAISVPTATRARPCGPSQSDEAGSERAPLRPRHIERMIDQRPRAGEEAHRVRQLGVKIERGLVLPPRVDVEQARIAHRAEGVNIQAARLLTGRSDRFANGLRERGFLALPGVKAGEDEKLQSCLPR